MHYIEVLSELPGSRIANVESDFNLLARPHKVRCRLHLKGVFDCVR